MLRKNVHPAFLFSAKGAVYLTIYLLYTSRFSICTPPLAGTLKKQLKLIRDNNADQIQASLAKQGIAVGRIIPKLPDNTFQFSGNVPFGHSSIRFSDAESAAEISEGRLDHCPRNA